VTVSARSARGRLGPRGLALVAVLVAAGAAILHFARPKGTQPELALRGDVLDAIPRGALAAVVIDLPAVRESPLGASLLGEGRRAAGLGEIEQLCGADPLEGVEQVALALSPEGVDAGFGVFAAGALRAERLLVCAERVLLERGGKPVRVQEDGFGVLRDGAALASAELAVRDDGPLVLSERAYLLEALAAAAGGPSLATDPAHAALRERIGMGAVVATAVLSESQRASLREASARPELAALSAGALRVELREAIDLHAIVLCDRPAACPAMAGELEAALRELASGPVARLLELRPMVERLRVRAEPDAVRIDGSVTLDELLAVQRRLETLEQLAPALDAPPK
jgi:hypothetical protein